MMKPTTIFLLITLTASLAWAMEPDPDDPDSQKVKAQDAITLSIQEIREITKFVKAIPRLKILHINHQTPELDLCVDHLVFDLEAMKSTLHRLKHLKRTNLLSSANSLKRERTHTVNLSMKCSKTFRNVDEIVPSMLTRKLGDLTMIIDDAVHLVSEIERDVYNRAETKRDV